MNFIFGLSLFSLGLFLWYKWVKLNLQIIAQKENRKYTYFVQEYLGNFKCYSIIDRLHTFPFSFWLHSIDEKSFLKEKEEVKALFLKKYQYEKTFWAVVVLALLVFLIALIGFF